MEQVKSKKKASKTVILRSLSNNIEKALNAELITREEETIMREILDKGLERYVEMLKTGNEK